jgi:hypothetical protein
MFKVFKSKRTKELHLVSVHGRNIIDFEFDTEFELVYEGTKLECCTFMDEEQLEFVNLFIN